MSPKIRLNKLFFSMSKKLFMLAMVLYSNLTFVINKIIVIPSLNLPPAVFIALGGRANS